MAYDVVGDGWMEQIYVAHGHEVSDVAVVVEGYFQWFQRNCI